MWLGWINSPWLDQHCHHEAMNNIGLNFKYGSIDLQTRPKLLNTAQVGLNRIEYLPGSISSSFVNNSLQYLILTQNILRMKHGGK